MSSPPLSEPAASPLPIVVQQQQQQRSSKKRRRSFRPTKGGRAKQQHQQQQQQQQKSSSTTNKDDTASSSAALPGTSNVEPGVAAAAAAEATLSGQQHIDSSKEAPTSAGPTFKDSDRTTTTTTATPSSAASKKRKRRKTTGVISVGSSRKTPTRTTSNDATETEAHLEEPSSIPAAFAMTAETATASTTTITTTSTPLEVSAERAIIATAASAAAAAVATEDPDEVILAEAEDDNIPRLNTYCSRYESRRHRLGHKATSAIAASENKKKKAQPKQQSNKTTTEENVVQTDDATAAAATARTTRSAAPVATATAATSTGTTTRTTKTTSAAAPMVQIVNGEIVLQESSMVVNGSVTKPDDEFSVVEEETELAVVGASYNSFVKRRRPQHWTVEETQCFYEALRQVGTDFGTMEMYFNSKRTRKQLKRKYQIESTKNPHLIEKALEPSARKEIDLSMFELAEEEKKKLEQAPASERQGIGGRNAGSTEIPVVREKHSSASEDRETILSADRSAAKPRGAGAGSVAMEQPAEASTVEKGPLQDLPMPPWLEDSALGTTDYADDVVNDPLLEAEEQQDTVVDSVLAPIVAKASKRKKRPRFRSVRKKNTVTK